MRILLDPAPIVGGAADPAPAPAAVVPASATPPTTPAPPAAPANVPLPPDEVSRLYGIARQFETFQADQRKAVEAEQHKAMVAQAKMGEVEAAFNTYKAEKDTQLATLQTAIVNRERSLTIAQSLAGASFINEQVAADVRQLLEFRVESLMGADGNPIVRDKQTGRPAADTIREWLASPAAAPYLKPTTPGGAGATGGHVPGPAAPQGADPLAMLGTPEQRAAGQYAAIGLVPRTAR